MKQPTFAQTRKALFKDLAALGWTIEERSARAPYQALKKPRAISPAGEVLEFHTQAIYHEGHSLTSDMREVTAAQLAGWVKR